MYHGVYIKDKLHNLAKDKKMKIIIIHWVCFSETGYVYVYVYGPGAG